MMIRNEEYVKIRLVIVLLFLTCFGIVYGFEYNFVKGQDNYQINSNKSLYDMTKWGDFAIPDSVTTVEIDSVIIVHDKSDTIYVFLWYYNLAFFCLKQHESFSLLYDQGLSYEGWFDLYCLDVNKDGNLDFVYQHGDECNQYLTILTYDYYNKDFILISNTDYFYFEGTSGDEPSIFQRVKVRKNKLYILYGFFPVKTNPSDENKVVIKYGVLDYSRDKTREIYFRPIGVITPEKWNKF